MELWIRSQDKECLMKVNRVDYDLSNGEHRIMVNGYETLVGRHKTKERALEVLDEIQNILLLKDMYVYDKEELLKGWKKFDEEEIKSIRKNLVVYEMPKE